jgi:hypothetical protein
MPTSRLSDLTELAAVLATDDLLYVVDKSNTTDDAGGSSFKITLSRFLGMLLPSLFEARLTTETGVPLSTSDRTAQSTIYVTPYLSGRVSLYDGTRWRMYFLAEVSLALSGLTSGKNYDVFLYDNAGTLTIELSAAWTSDTARTDALTTQDNILVKSGALTRRYVGTIRTTATTTTEDSLVKRFVWNHYNRVPKSMKRSETTDGWVYDSGTFRQANAAAANQLDYVVGQTDVLVEARVMASWAAGPAVAVVSNATPYERVVGVGVDSTTTSSAQIANASHGMSADGLTTLEIAAGAPSAEYRAYSALGRHTLVWLERGGGGEDETTIWFGDVAFNSGSGTGLHNGISGWLMG